MRFETPVFYLAQTLVVYESEPPAACNFYRGARDIFVKHSEIYTSSGLIEVLAYPYGLSDLSLGHHEGRPLKLYIAKGYKLTMVG